MFTANLARHHFIASALRQFTVKASYVMISAEAVKCKTYLMCGLVKHSCTSCVCVCECLVGGWVGG